MKKILSIAWFIMAGISFVQAQGNAQSVTFASGADVSWCTEMEADGKKFYNESGQETEMMALLKQIGMNAVRLRVWVNPENDYGPWCDKADVLAKARRAQAQGLALMIDFHYSDRFTDPSQQIKPAAWNGYNMEQLKKAVADHTTDVLSALKAESIEPLWVQVGNETRPGMIFNEGKIDWNKSGSAAWSGYIALSNAGYDAVKQVFPNATVIVHIDRAPEDNAWFYNSFKQYGGKFDMIGLSHYPDWDNWSSDNTKTANNIETLNNTFKVPVMIVETGYSSWDEARAKNVMDDLFAKTKKLSACAGIFFWEPEVYGSWKPAAYTKWKWNAYDKGAFKSNGRPSTALSAFRMETSGISQLTSSIIATMQYNLQGQKVGDSAKGVIIQKQGNTWRKILRK